MSNIYIYTAWVNTPSKRLEEAQMRFLKSCVYFNYVPVFYTDIHIPEQRPKMDDLIQYGVTNCKEKGHEWLVWINSDCEIVKDFRPYLKKGRCHGFHRTEIPSKKYCAGLDMFAIHESLWDGLTEDMPDMYVGATHIDWWLARYFQKKNLLDVGYNFLYHNEHKQSKEGSQFSRGEISQHNINNFIEWAKRNDVDYKTGWE